MHKGGGEKPQEEKRQIAVYAVDANVLSALAKLRSENQADTMRHALQETFGEQYEAMKKLVQPEESEDPDMMGNVA